MNEITIDFDTCKIIIFLKLDRVIFVSKWGAQSQAMSIPEFYDTLEKVAAKKPKSKNL